MVQMMKTFAHTVKSKTLFSIYIPSLNATTLKPAFYDKVVDWFNAKFNCDFSPTPLET